MRTFDEHELRCDMELGGFWEFVIEPERRDRGRLPGEYNRMIHVPSAWESMPGLENYRGRAWMRTSIPGSAELATRLVFGGVSHTGTVYVNGREIGSHYDAFTPWSVNAGVLGPGSHELVVEVDNSFGPHSALHIENDYYTYGGITRPVRVQLVPEVYVDRIFCLPVRAGSGWDLDVRVRIRNSGSRSITRKTLVALDLPGTCVDLGRVTLKPGAVREVRGRLRRPDVKPWSPQEPNLYSVQALLMDGDEPVDDLIDRIGFRRIQVKGRKLLLNGRPIRLAGYNRHEDHPRFGCALPLATMVQDLQTMRDLGCNFVRTCHYPNDLRFLDLCDELGICVWEESHARTVDFRHPLFRQQIADSTREMVEWHFNRPSILLWGCLNECESDTVFGRREHARVIKLIKKLDMSRPVTFASNRADRDLCLGLVDVVAWNRYDAWYGGAPSDIEPELKKMLKWLHSDRSRGGKGKPVIMSEFGAGGIFGCRGVNHAKWTEEYQAEVLDESLRVYLNHPGVVGAAIWQFCDVRVTGDWWSGRPRTMNNKGTVDEYRRPKLCYEVVKKRMREAGL